MLDRPAVGTGAAKQAAAAKVSAAALPAAREHLLADGSVNLCGIVPRGVAAWSTSPAAREEWARAGNPRKRNLVSSPRTSWCPRRSRWEKLRPLKSTANIREDFRC